MHLRTPGIWYFTQAKPGSAVNSHHDMTCMTVWDKEKETESAKDLSKGWKRQLPTVLCGFKHIGSAQNLGTMPKHEWFLSRNVLIALSRKKKLLYKTVVFERLTCSPNCNMLGAIKDFPPATSLLCSRHKVRICQKCVDNTYLCALLFSPVNSLYLFSIFQPLSRCCFNSIGKNIVATILRYVKDLSIPSKKIWQAN